MVARGPRMHAAELDTRVSETMLQDFRNGPGEASPKRTKKSIDGIKPRVVKRFDYAALHRADKDPLGVACGETTSVHAYAEQRSKETIQLEDYSQELLDAKFHEERRESSRRHLTEEHSTAQSLADEIRSKEAII